MLFLLNLFIGYVEIEVSGTYSERFLNLLSVRNIRFWNLNYEEYGKMTLCIHAKNFHLLRPIVRRTKSKVKILKKHGLPFFNLRFKGRWALVFGIFAFCTAVWILTSFVWVINIEGGDSTLYPNIMKQLSYNGVKTGGFVPSIDHDSLKNDLLLTFPELSDITVNIRGSVANVNIYMKTPVPEILDKKTPSNIISDYDGIITSITVTSGTPEVKPGDAVRRGQLLASGYMTGRTGVVVEFRALADIRAKTLESKKIVMSDKTLKKSYTGNSKKKYSLIFGKNRMNLHFGTGNSYDTCDKIIEKVQLTLPFGIGLPVYLETCTYNEYTQKEVSVSSDAAKTYLSEKPEKYIELKENDTILTRNSNFSKESGYLSLYFSAQCERKIGVEQMIPKGE